MVLVFAKLDRCSTPTPPSLSQQTDERVPVPSAGSWTRTRLTNYDVMNSDDESFMCAIGFYIACFLLTISSWSFVWILFFFFWILVLVLDWASCAGVEKGLFWHFWADARLRSCFREMI